MLGRVSARRLCIALIAFVSASFAILPPALAADEDLLAAERFTGLELRSIGPALMAGRIADIAIHPDDDNLWYVAVGSGGVWKTRNAGVTWTPIFDDQASYSIGCVTIDPQDPEVVWVGTGENVGGRHVGYGDGIYRSDDGGATWVHKGLENSEHIAEIVVHPEDSNTLWVAAQGPLWSKGGDRGVFMTTDGGATWERVLGDDEWIGATELVIDPRDPDRLYAATWQRHRNVAAYMGGGPGTGLHRSTDGGRSWQKLTQGLPKSRMGKIGLTISPLRPDVLYAAIELDRRSGAVYRSSDRGSSWEKRSDTVSGGTGPHYYQELYASPHKFDRIYLADVRMQISEDGGTTFRRMKEESKHSDNHAMAFRADDPDYLLVGTDGGLYESFDLAENWRFIANMPITQFYKLAVDDAEPFYNVYGGTQDNATQGGPSRTDNVHGIQNSDWGIILDWDGHQPATEPGNPDIVYGQRQQGYLTRTDRTTGEIIDIQPQAGPGEGPERYNWDAPILVSPHQATRLYFASHRVWRSDNRGDSWEAISGDLTRNQERLTLPIMGQTQSWDNAWDISAMSTYNTITSLAESPQLEGLIYAGTDDGLIQVTEPDVEGQDWRAIEVGSLPGVPDGAYVNDIKADLFDVDTVYVALDHHKFGEFGPHLLRSQDRGRKWTSMRGNLPERTLVWRLVQDHVRPELFFAATEFGIYFTIDAGSHWTQLKGGVPTISFRDLAIQRRENDLVGASFGRSFYVLDDYSPLRDISKEQLEQEATLFAPRDAWWYFPRPHLSFQAGRGDQGAGHYVAPNPPFGAVVTYYLKDDLETRKVARQEREKAAEEANEAVGFPGWEAVEQERREPEPSIWLVVRDSEDRIVRRIPGPTSAGFHRVAWDLRYPTPNAVELVEPPPPAWGDPPSGLMVAPGTYQVALAMQADGKARLLSEPKSFEVKPLHGGASNRGALAGASPEEVAAFWRQYEAAVHEQTAIQVTMTRLLTRVERMARVIEHSRVDLLEIDPRFHELRRNILELDGKINGLRSKSEPGEKAPATIGDRIFAVSRGVGLSTYGPTPSHRQSLEIATTEMADLRAELERNERAFSELARELIAAGAPWLEGEPLP